MAEDGLTWTFVLRKDVTYHNGQTVKAKDIVACINELKNIAADENRSSIYAVNMELIASASATDDTTFTITATEKTNRVLAALLFPIIPDKTTGTSLPTGCGPYKVVSFQNFRKGDSGFGHGLGQHGCELGGFGAYRFVDGFRV